MRRIWNGWLKEGVFIYCVVYTVTTIVNSVGYLMQGIRDDPSGNWHELMRAMIVLIGVIAYEMARHLPVRNIILRTLIVYAVTLPCAFLVVWSSQFIEPLAKSAYRDAFVNYTGFFLVIAVVVIVVHAMRRRGQARREPSEAVVR